MTTFDPTKREEMEALLRVTRKHPELQKIDLDDWTAFASWFISGGATKLPPELQKQIEKLRIEPYGVNYPRLKSGASAPGVL